MNSLELYEYKKVIDDYFGTRLEYEKLCDVYAKVQRNEPNSKRLVPLKRKMIKLSSKLNPLEKRLMTALEVAFPIRIGSRETSYNLNKDFFPTAETVNGVGID